MPDNELRKQLVKMLKEPNAHLMFDKIVAGFPEEHYGTKKKGCSHTAWQLLEHLRLAQEDILDFCVNPDYESRDWPDDYWPKKSKPEQSVDWSKSVKAFKKDLQGMVDLIEDEVNDLFAPFEHGDGQTLLREAILLIKHNSYHLGQLMMLRKCLEQAG